MRNWLRNLAKNPPPSKSGIMPDRETGIRKFAVYVIRAFIRLREVLAENQVMAKRMADVEKTLVTHDAALRDIYQKIRPLLLPPPDPPRKKIGF
jgi:hypothetical protein